GIKNKNLYLILGKITTSFLCNVVIFPNIKYKFLFLMPMPILQNLSLNVKISEKLLTIQTLKD
ncbi:MAG: hypothetical protein ACE5DO_04585, partial [Desulfobacterales bacterium]